MPHPQAVARQAHPLRAIEAEELRTRRVEPHPASSTGVVRRQEQVGLALRATMTVPSPSLSACSTASASRGRTAGPALSRSITTSILCLICRSSPRSSDSPTTWPLTRART